LITELIIRWSFNDFASLHGGYDCGTDSAYPRWKLRELAGFDDIPANIKDMYPFDDDNRYSANMKRTREAFGFTQDDESSNRVSHVCKQARKWVEKHEAEYKLLRKKT
jgi:DNA-directed RNA polymerase delta subunit